MLSLSGQDPSEGSKNNDLDSLIEFTIVSSVSLLDIKSVPSSLSVFQLAGFTKYIDVFGIHLLSTVNVPDSKLIHIANVLAQYLDNDADGSVDDELILDELLERNAFITIVRDDDEYSSLDIDSWESSGFINGTHVLGDSVMPSDGSFDGALEGVLKLIFDTGYSNVYSGTFGLSVGSTISEYMDNARGGYFKDLPDLYDDDAWFHNLDEECDYSCQISKYFYWALTSILGAQEDYCEDVSSEWEPCTSDLLESTDPDVYSLLTNGEFVVPTKIPDGNYSPSAGQWIDSESLIVEIDGERAIDKGAFRDGFDGGFSEITPDGDNLLVVIDPETSFLESKAVFVKIQVKDLNGKYLNNSYIFKTILSKPVLVATSPEKDGMIKTPQAIYLEFQDLIDGIDKDSINVSINGVDAVIDGSIQYGYSGDLAAIDDIVSGESAYVMIDPSEPLRDGFYKIEYSVSDLNDNALSGSFSFDVKLNEAIRPAAFPQTGFVGFYKGIKKISDVGCGDSLMVEWPQLAKRYYGSDAFALIYENTDRLSLFDGDPSYIAAASTSSGFITGLTPGETMYYGVRALETYKGSLDITGLEALSDDIFKLPDPVEIAQAVMADDTRVFVESISGYPQSGILIVGNEVVKYTAVSEDNNSFLLPSNGRGLNGTSPSVHVAGDSVKLFTACQDKNMVIVAGTPTYHKDHPSGREIDNVGLVVNDYSDNDRKFFQGFDFCGYHTPLPQQIFQGKNDCGSYLGGEFNGMRGMNLFDRMLNREEVLLDQTGEPIVLLKRIWDGATCSCMDNRRIHPKIKDCNVCYGTGYEDGYQQYANLRREDRKTMISFGDTQEDLSLDFHKALQQEYEPQCWTLPIPAIRDRDLIVRFDFTGDLEFVYEVLHVTKEKLVYTHYSRQRLQLKRMDKTDIIYTFPFE